MNATRNDQDNDRDWLPGPAARRGLLWLLPILLLALALIGGLMYREGIWLTRDELNFRTDSAEGLTKGMAVKLHGFAIGTVTAVALDPETDQRASVLVRMAIERRFMALIPQGSVLSSAQEGLIGQNYLFITPPADAEGSSRRTVADGEQLPFERPKALSEIASDMARKLEPFVIKAGELTSALADPDGDLRQIIHQTRLATDRAPALAGQTGEVLQRAEQTLAAASDSLTQVSARLPRMLEQSGQTLTHVEATSARVRELTERHGGATLDSAQQVAEDAREVMSSARRAWPLRQLAPPADYEMPTVGGITPLLLPTAPGAVTEPVPPPAPASQGTAP